MIIGYARVSSQGQNLARQEESLAQAGVEKVSERKRLAAILSGHSGRSFVILFVKAIVSWFTIFHALDGMRNRSKWSGNDS